MPKISFRDLDSMDCTQHKKDKDMKGEGLGKLPSNIERLMDKSREKSLKKNYI